MASLSNDPDGGIDILVAARNGNKSLLAVKVKGRHADAAQLRTSEEQLRRYMFGMRCSVGLLVTPERLRLLRDEYLSESPESITVAGEYPTPPPLSRWQDEHIWSATPQPELAFEEEVQQWLEGLSRPDERDAIPRELQNAIVEHVLPALGEGEVGAAGPRWHRWARSAG